ncbi:hypothetical protein Ct61P_15479 [Colletotrichum tofieldiae]|nr:hypothetical protein Ct61P_15479 [Colletotrichum tofieldiae]
MAGHAGLWPMVSFLLAEDDGSFHDGSSLPKMQGVWIDDTRGRYPAHYAIELCPQLLEYLVVGSTVRKLIKGDQDGLNSIAPRRALR